MNIIDNLIRRTPKKIRKVMGSNSVRNFIGMSVYRNLLTHMKSFHLILPKKSKFR